MRSLLANKHRYSLTPAKTQSSDAGVRKAVELAGRIAEGEDEAAQLLVATKRAEDKVLVDTTTPMPPPTAAAATARAAAATSAAPADAENHTDDNDGGGGGGGSGAWEERGGQDAPVKADRPTPVHTLSGLITAGQARAGGR